MMWPLRFGGSRTETSLSEGQELKLQPYAPIERSKKVIVYDVEEGSTYVTTEEYVLNSKAPSTAQACTNASSPSEFEVHQTLQIPSSSKFYIYEEPDNTYTLQAGGENGLSLIVELGDLRLWHRALHFAGKLNNLFIVNGKSVDENNDFQNMITHGAQWYQRRSTIEFHLRQAQKSKSQIETCAEPSRKAAMLLDWSKKFPQFPRVKSEEYILESKRSPLACSMR